MASNGTSNGTAHKGGRLDGKVCIITGGGMGFGKGIVEKFVAEGAKVVLADFSKDLGEKAASEFKCDFHFTNVAKKADWENLAKAVVEKHGRIDVVVNNAGTTYANKSTLDVTDEEFDLVMNVNVRSIHYSVLAVVPQMQKQGGGSIVTIGSTAGLRPRPNLAWYCASKACVMNASKALALEFAKDNVRFNCVCPVVAFGTGLTDLFIGASTPENAAKFKATVPLGRGSTPRDVANACAYLASDEADFVTGISMEVDGGRCV